MIFTRPLTAFSRSFSPLSFVVTMASPTTLALYHSPDKGTIHIGRSALRGAITPEWHFSYGLAHVDEIGADR
jgi:hypothetical protein